MNITRDQWLSALATVAPIPEHRQDAITVAEFAVLVGIRRTSAHERMRALVEAKKARRVTKEVRDVMGRPQLVPAYVLIQETPDEPVARLQHTRRRSGR